ncbi:MAG: hypothetical protein CMF31_02505 [Kordiimonas sp.]|nr:hypothetical protein [Kordiimonas sp.]|tara:strand:- start:264 stop:563 length:300 start_codon:yes stop_codon:yes gene_type:complete
MQRFNLTIDLLYAVCLVAILYINMAANGGAEYVNPYFLLMELGHFWHGQHAPGPFLIGQEKLGLLAYPVAFIVWCVEAWLLLWVMRFFFRLGKKTGNKL